MHKLANVSSAGWSGTESRFIVQEAEPFQVLEATGEMSADHESDAFLYRLSTGKKAVYVSFGKEVWPEMSKALGQELLPVLIWGEQTIPLRQFHEELRRLVDSLGNGNDRFAEAVREAFQESAESGNQDR